MTSTSNAEKKTAEIDQDQHHHQESHHDEVSQKDRLDRLGAILGFLCAIHCAITPLSFLFVPIIGLGSLWSFKGEITLLLFALIFTLPSMFNAYKQKGLIPSNGMSDGIKVVIVFMLSWSFLGASTVLKSNEHAHNSAFEQKVAHPHQHRTVDSNHESEKNTLKLNSHLENQRPTADHPLANLSDLKNHQKVHSHSTLSLSFAVLGGIGLAIAHLLNLRRRKKIHQACCHH